MLETYFSAPKTLRRLRVESVDHTSTRSPMTSNARDTHRQAPFDTSEPRLISAASFSGKGVFWRASISRCLNPFAAIFGVADALTSSAEGLATTPSSE